jgi:hypothetical protein
LIDLPRLIWALSPHLQNLLDDLVPREVSLRLESLRPGGTAGEIKHSKSFSAAILLHNLRYIHSPGPKQLPPLCAVGALGVLVGSVRHDAASSEGCECT